MTTIENWLEQVSEATSAGTRRAYRTYWRKFAEMFGDRAVSDITTQDVQQFLDHVKETAVNRSRTDSSSSEENAVAALRRAFTAAVTAGLIETSPAAKVEKPPRRKEVVRVLTSDELAALFAAVAGNSKDPQLHRILMRAHYEAAAEPEELRRLRWCDVDVNRSLLRLAHPQSSVSYVPISLTLLHMLEEHYQDRGEHGPDSALLRNQAGRELSNRHWDTLCAVWRRALPWAQTRGVSSRWLRDTAVRNVAWKFGETRATRFARNDQRTGATPLPGTLEDLVEVNVWLTGEEHPLLDH